MNETIHNLRKWAGDLLKCDHFFQEGHPLPCRHIGVLGNMLTWESGAPTKTQSPTSMAVKTAAD